MGRSWAVLARSWAIWGRSRAVLGRSWGDLGRVLGRTWVILGWSWGILGWSCGVLGRSWPLLGRSWAALGCSWRLFGPSWPLLVRSSRLLAAPRGRFWKLLAALGATSCLLKGFGMHLLGILGTNNEQIEKIHQRLKASDALWICLRSCTLLNLSRFPFHARTGFFGGVLAALFRSWAVLGCLGRSWSPLPSPSGLVGNRALPPSILFLPL